MDNYEKTKSILWGNSDITQESANKALQLKKKRKIDFGDLFFFLNRKQNHHQQREKKERKQNKNFCEKRKRIGSFRPK